MKCAVELESGVRDVRNVGVGVLEGGVELGGGVLEVCAAVEETEGGDTGTGGGVGGVEELAAAAEETGVSETGTGGGGGGVEELAAAAEETGVSETGTGGGGGGVEELGAAAGTEFEAALGTLPPLPPSLYGGRRSKAAKENLLLLASQHAVPPDSSGRLVSQQ